MAQKIKVKKRFFGILIIILIGIAAYFAIISYKKIEHSSKKEGLHGVSTLPIEQAPIQQAKKPLDGLENSYTITSSISAYFETEKGERPSYGIYVDDKKANLTFTLKEKSQGVKTTDKTIEYDVVIQNIPMKMRLTTMGNKVKEEFIIEKKPNLEKDLSILFDVKKEGVGNGVANDDGTYTFTLPSGDTMIVEKPTVLDSNEKSGKISGKFTKDTYEMVMDRSFLENATYPVIIDPAVVVTTTSETAYPTTLDRTVRTSDGTLHSFIRVGTQSATCGGQSRSGLLWFTSSDSGGTWICQDQVDSSTTVGYYPDVKVDSSDNIYVVYSVIIAGRNDAYDIIYRKFSYNGSSAWTMQSPQTVLDGSGSGTAYAYTVIALEDTSRIWLATRFYNGTNYGVSVYYSDSLGNSPIWTVSQATLDTANSSSSYHVPEIVRFGSKIGVFYSGSISILWRYRVDSEGLTNWANEATAMSTSGSTVENYTVIPGDNGVIFAAFFSSQTQAFVYDGIAWSSSITPPGYAGSFGSIFGGLSTDGTNLWIIYPRWMGGTGISNAGAQLAYVKCVPPFATANCDTTATPFNSYQAIFAKVWSYSHGSTSYTDSTTAAGNNTTADVFNSNTTRMLSAVGDIMYFGQTEAFDAISWDLSTNGSGGTAVWEYCSAVDVAQACTTWSALSFLASSGTNLTADGYGTFTAPGDWVAAKVNGEGTVYYYVRVRASVLYTTGPIGTQMVPFPNQRYTSPISRAYSNTVGMVWNEGPSASTIRVRFASISVTTSPSAGVSTNIDPKVVGYTGMSTIQSSVSRRELVRTSDGTLHAFIQSGAQLACGSSASQYNTVGLVWVSSTDGGITWECRGQLSSDTTNFMQADVRADSSDNLYAVYTVATTGRNNAYDIYYRKFTKGSGATWTMESAQTVLDGSAAGTGYHYAVLELQGTDRIWLAARYYNGTNYGVTVYYSDGLTNAPTWTQSVATLDTAGTSSTGHTPSIVRFADKIGIPYVTNSGAGVNWRYRSDSDDLTSWNNEAVINASGSIQSPGVSVVGTTSGNVYMVIAKDNPLFTAWTGSSWSSVVTIGSTYSLGPTFVTTDDKDAWIFYSDRNVNFTATGRPVYRKCVSPFASANCSSATYVVPQYGVFESLWRYVAANNTYNNYISTAATRISGEVGDVMYYGKAQKFDSMQAWFSTAGTVGVVTWEYWNGSNWVAVNMTSGSGYSYNTQFGFGFIFIPGNDWVTTRINNEDKPLYYLRSRVVTAFSTIPVGVEFLTTPRVYGGGGVTLNVFNNKVGYLWTELGNSIPARIRFAEFTDGQPLPVKPAAQFNRGVRIQRGTTIEGGNP